MEKHKTNSKKEESKLSNSINNNKIDKHEDKYRDVKEASSKNNAKNKESKEKSSKEKNKGDKGKERKTKTKYVYTGIVILLFLVAVFYPYILRAIGVWHSDKGSYHEGLDYSKTYTADELPDAYSYNGLRFVKRPIGWNVKLRFKNRPNYYVIGFMYSPLEVNDVYLDPKVRFTKNYLDSHKSYRKRLTIDKLFYSAKALYATTNFTRFLSDDDIKTAIYNFLVFVEPQFNRLNKPTQLGMIEKLGPEYEGINYTLTPVVSCHNATPQIPVIVFEIDPSLPLPKIYAINDCIIIKAKDGKDLHRAIDRFLYYLLGIMG